MRKNKDNMLDSVLVVTAVVVSSMIGRRFGLGFWENFFSCLLAGLLVLLIAWIIKNINRKKLRIMFITKQLPKEKFEIAVLLWNSSWLKSVYSSDYGGRGFGLVANYGTVIGKLGKPKQIKNIDKFNFDRIPDSDKNALNLSMDDLPPGAFIEFSFEICENEITEHNSVLTLPSGVKTEERFKAKPNISLRYDRANLNIRELRYKKSTQIFHWFCRYAALLTIVGTAIVVFLSELSIINVIGAGLMILTVFITTSVSWGNFIPPSVAKHMKRNGYIDYKG